MRTTRLVMIALVIALCFSMAAWSQDAPPPGQPPAQPRWQGGMRAGGASAGSVSAALMVPPQMMIDNLATTLGISDDQKQKISAAMEASRTKLEPLRKTLTKSVTALRKALFDSTKDAAAVRAAVDTAQKAEAVVAAAELDAWLEIRSNLKEDQLQKLGEAMGRGGRRMGPGPGGPPPPGPGGPPPTVPPPPPPGE